MAREYSSRDIDPRRVFTFPGDVGDLMPSGLHPRDSKYHNIATTGDGNTPPTLPLVIASRYRDNMMRLFKYALAGEALVEGDVLIPAAEVAVETVSSSTDLTEITEAAAGWTEGAYAGYFVTVDDGTGKGQTRRIKWNSATTLYLEDPLREALAVATSDITIWHPHKVRKSLGSALVAPVVGVAIGAIASGKLGFIQTYGFCEQVNVDAAMVASGILVPSNATAGNAEEWADANAGVMTPFATAYDTTWTTRVNAGAVPAFLWGCVG